MIRMKYKMVALLVALLFVFTGCSGTQAEYWNKMKQSYKWEGVEMKQTGQVVVQVGPEQMKADIKTTARMNQKEMSGHFNIEMKMEMPASLMVPGEEGTPVTTNVVKPQPIVVNMEIYMDKGKVYISKSYFEQAFKLTGQPVPEALKKLDAKYIGLKESNELVEVMFGMLEGQVNMDEYIKAYEELGKLLGINIPVVKEGNTYKVTLGKKEIVTLIKSIMNNGVANIEKFNELAELQLTKEDIALLKENYATQKAMIENQIDQLAMMVDGNISVATTFEKDKQIDKIRMKLGPAPEMAPFLVNTPEANMNMEMKFDQTSTKVAPKAIKIPGKVVELSEEELSVLMGMPEMMYMEETAVPNK